MVGTFKHALFDGTFDSAWNTWIKSEQQNSAFRQNLNRISKAQ